VEQFIFDGVDPIGLDALLKDSQRSSVKRAQEIVEGHL
jgi:hypothetical protein